MALESILLRYISLWNFHSEDGLFFPFLKIPFVMDQSIYRDDLLIVDAKIHLVFVNTNGKPTKIPEIVLNSFEPYILKSK